MELQSLSQIHCKESLSSQISTFSSLDDLLGGGITTGSVTQIAGESGIGKTQLSFQLCLDVQIPKYLGGLEGEAVYLDTENTFHSMRLLEMAEALIHHYQKGSKELKDMSAQKFLSGIYMFRCLDIVQLLAASHQMFEFINQHPKVKLIVVDSVANCIRHEEDSKARIKFLNTLAENFRKLALRYDIAVVVINQVTTSFSASDHPCIVPALGQTWSYVPSTKIMLIKQNNERYALLYKSPTQPRGAVRFCVDKCGFRDYSTKIEKSSVSLHSYVLTQTIANELLCNDFDSSHEVDDSKQLNAPEDISEKWLLLSQNQLDSTCNNLNDSEDVFDETIHEMENHEAKTEPFIGQSAVEKPTSLGKSDDAERNNSRPSSPILISRPAKRRKLRPLN